MIPKLGTLERIVLEKMIEQPVGVTYLDFVGTGVTLENIDEIVNNLRHGLFIAEDDVQIKFDA